MNGEFAQIIALAAYGNLFLSGRGAADLSTNSTFRYVGSVKFARYRSNQDTQGSVVANSVSDWFAWLRSNNAARLWHIGFGWQRQDMAEHVAVAFSGGVPKAIQADMPTGYELWYPQWTYEGNRWLVEYRALMFPNSHVMPIPKMSIVKGQLRQAVSNAEKFCQRRDVNESTWAPWFTKALQLLASSTPEVPSHPDILPALGFSLEARQVMAAAAQAFVFAGQGSWNDLGFAKPDVNQEYQRVSKELYEALKVAVVMVPNSFAL